MQVHVLTEPMPGPQLPAMVVPTVAYRELHPGSSRVPMCLHNLSTHIMEIPAKTVVGQVDAANQIPPEVHQTRASEELNHKPQKGWVLEALDFQGLQGWPESEQKQARELLLKWEHLFACSDLYLGKTTMIKHKALHRVLPMYTSPHIQQHDGPYPGNAGYGCYPKVTQPMG